MEELTTQIKSLLEGKKNILIVSHQKIDGDGLSSMLVLKKLFERMGKEVTALSMDDIPEVYHFLPSVNEVERTLRSSNDFIISLKTDGVEVDKLKYSVDGDTLNIVVSPKNGLFSPENIAAKQAIGKYDLIFVLDSGDLEHLGAFYEEHTEMFYETPIVNIDHHTTNTAFGQVNIVDVMAASTTQIVYQLSRDMEKGDESLQNFFDADIATLLLTGLIVDTGSFQHTNTSPRALELAADLIEMGARQQEIIQNIYKTKQLSTLKLWGRVLAKIEEDPVHKIVWSTITKEDLQETGASVEEAEGLIDELMTNAPGAEIVALMKNSFDGLMTCSLRSTNVTIDTLPIANHFGGGGHKQASGLKQKGYNFSLFTADIIDFIEKYQEERLGLSQEDVQALREEYESKQKQREVSSQNKYESVKGSEKLDIISEISEKSESQKSENVKREHSEKPQQTQQAQNQQGKKSQHPHQQKQGNTEKPIQTQQAQQSQPVQNQQGKKPQHPHQQKQGEKKPQSQAQGEGNNKQQMVKKEEKVQILPQQNRVETQKPVEEVQNPVAQAPVVESPESTPAREASEQTVQETVSTPVIEAPTLEVSETPAVQEDFAPIMAESPVQEEQTMPSVSTATPAPEAQVQPINSEQAAPMNQATNQNPFEQAIQQSNLASPQESVMEEAPQVMQEPMSDAEFAPETFSQEAPTQEAVTEPVFDDYEANKEESTPAQEGGNEPSFLTTTPQQEVQQAAPAETAYQQQAQGIDQNTQYQQQAQQMQATDQSAQYQAAYAQQQAQYQQQQQYQQQAVDQAQYAQQQAQYQQAQQAQSQQQGQQQVTKEQAAQYAQYYAQQLHQMNPQTAEYAQVYQYYTYYAQMAQ